MTANVVDVIDVMLGLPYSAQHDTLRSRRAQARTNAQDSYTALFAATHASEVTFSQRDRFAVAAFVAGVHQQPAVAAFYERALHQQTDGAALGSAIRWEVEAALRFGFSGPYGLYPPGPLQVEDVPGPHFRVDIPALHIIGERLAAALEHAHLLVFHPRDASSASLQSLLDAGWSTTDTVTLSQMIAFLAFQIRVVAGLRVLFAPEGGATGDATLPNTTKSADMADDIGKRDLASDVRDAGAGSGTTVSAEVALTYPDSAHPTAYTKDVVPWLPWLEPMTPESLTERHWTALVDPARVKSPYFRLLARAPEILGTRTRTDKDIFFNPDGGLPRGERELAATATSRFNGCVYCASVHARFSSTYTKRGDDVQRLLDEGVTVDIDARWNAIIAASVALTTTPIGFKDQHVQALRRAGLDDLSIMDAINGAAFFNWANRLMLSLGQPGIAAAAI
jgi:alkylhydroperoxidase domain protein/CMD domain protein